MSGIAGTPATEWSQQTLAALQNPTSHTGGYVEPHVPSSSIPTSSNTTTTAAPTHGFAAGVSPIHASGGIPPQSQSQSQSAAYASGMVTGGGLATSPNVQALSSAGSGSGSPASTILQQEGFTRSQLANNMTSAGLAGNRAGSTGTGTGLEGLSGREQAAAQLGGAAGVTGGQTQTSGLDTPGLEVPGGFGVTSATSPTTTIYQDVSTVLHDVGTAAFSVLPKSLVEKVSTHPSTTQTTTTTTTTRTTTSGPVLPSAESVTNTLGNIFNQVKHVVSEIKEDIKSELNAAPSVSSGVEHSRVNATGWTTSDKPATTTTTTTGTGKPISEQVGGLVEQAKALALSGVQSAQAAAQSAGETASAVYNNPLGSTSGTSGISTSHAVAPATSLPTDEFAGARAGESSGGVGALPGKATETGVAILPDERKAESHVIGGVGDLPGTPNETNVLDIPDVNKGTSRSVGDSSSAPTSTIAAPTSTTATPSTSSQTPFTTGRATDSSSLDHLGLAPPLGAFVGATPIPHPDSSRAAGIPEGVGIAVPAVPAAVIAVKDLESHSMPANNRTDSLASTTAVLHGTPGDRHSEKVEPPAELNTVPEKAVVPPKEFNSLETDHKVPGTETGAVGHKSEPVEKVGTPVPAPGTETGVPGPDVSGGRTQGPGAAANSEAHHLMSNDGEGHSVYKNAIAAEPAFDHHILTEENDPVKAAAVAESAPVTGTTSHDSHATDSPKKTGFLSKIKNKLHHEK